jgi:hypothetical protein
MSTVSTVSIMYNGCYGGFHFSNEAIDEYNRRKPANHTRSSEYKVSRADPLMVQICKEMGPRANGQFSDILIKEIPAKFQNCYSIHEYDGMEWVSISFGKYQLDCIRLIMSTKNMSNDEKVRMIGLTLSEPDTDCDTPDDEPESPQTDCDSPDDEPEPPRSNKEEAVALPDVGSIKLNP